MKSIIIILIFEFITINVFSQNDSITLSKISKETTKTELITKFRALLMDNFISKNPTKVKIMMDSTLQSIDNDYYIALYPFEKVSIWFWLRDYNSITKLLKTIDTNYVVQYNRKVKPKEDQLEQIIHQETINNTVALTIDIKNSLTLVPEDKAFLMIILNTHTSDKSQKNYQEDINKKVTSFLNDFPNSKFESYLKNYVQYEYKPKGFAWGMEFLGGSTIFQNSLSETFRNGGLFGMGFIWKYKNIQLNTRFSFGGSELKKSVYYNLYEWRTGERVQIFIPELSLQYPIQIQKKLTISPLVGLGWFSAAPYQVDIDKNKVLKDISVDSKGSIMLGVDIGWNFYRIYYYNPLYRRLMNAFSSLNLHYHYQPVKFESVYSYLNGSAHTLALSIKFGFGGAQRVK